LFAQGIVNILPDTLKNGIMPRQNALKNVDDEAIDETEEEKSTPAIERKWYAESKKFKEDYDNERDTLNNATNPTAEKKDIDKNVAKDKYAIMRKLPTITEDAFSEEKETLSKPPDSTKSKRKLSFGAGLNTAGVVFQEGTKS
jgi:hypothetical protein